LAYSPTNWQDRVSANPGQFTVSGDVTGTIVLVLNDNPTQAGTQFTAALMNKIEQALAQVSSVTDTLPTSLSVGTIYLNNTNNVNAPPTTVYLASSNPQGVGMTEYGDLVPINPSQIQNGTYWTVQDKNGNPMWKVYLSGGAIDCEAYWRCYGGLYVPNGQATWLINGIGSNYSWSGTISYQSSVTITHGLGHKPIMTALGTTGNIRLAWGEATASQSVNVSNYPTVGGNSWTGTIYFW
jgi:hypothetical protein